MDTKTLTKVKCMCERKNHRKDLKIQNTTGHAWACMYAYAHTQVVLMYSSNTGGS